MLALERDSFHTFMREMRACLPVRWQKPPQRATWPCTIAPDTVIILPETEYLRQIVTVPEKSVRSLSTLLRHNFSIWTPFQFEDVYVAARFLPKSTPHQRSIELRYLPKTKLPSSVQVLELGDAAFRVDCTPPSLSRSQKLTIGLAAWAVIQGVGLSMALDTFLEARSDAINTALRSVAQTVRQSQELQNRLILEQQRSLKQPISRLLRELAGQFQNDVVVRDVQINQNRGRLVIAAPPDTDPAQRLRSVASLQLTDVAVLGKESSSVTLYALSFVLKEAKP
jgi:hypothetical protein